MNRPFVVSLLSLALLSACGGPDLVGTYSVVGEEVWRITWEGQTRESRFETDDHATVRNVSSAEDFKLKLNGCEVEFGLGQGGDATLIPGARCVYNVDGLPVAEVYRTATLRNTDQDRADYSAAGELVVPMQDGSDFILGTFSVTASMWRTSEFVERSLPDPEDALRSRITGSAD